MYLDLITSQIKTNSSFIINFEILVVEKVSSLLQYTFHLISGNLLGILDVPLVAITCNCIQWLQQLIAVLLKTGLCYQKTIGGGFPVGKWKVYSLLEHNFHLISSNLFGCLVLPLAVTCYCVQRLQQLIEIDWVVLSNNNRWGFPVGNETMSNERNYNAIINRLISSAQDTLGEAGLVETKSEFDRVINSKRRSSCIKDFRELVAVLQKRGHISEHSVEPLRRISLKLNDQHLNLLMDSYEECLQNYRRQFFNVYTRSIREPFVHNYPRDDISSVSSLSYQSSLFRPAPRESSSHQSSSFRPASRGSSEEGVLPQNVIDFICIEIGRQWMDLARELSLREGEIDSINSKHPSDLKAKAREVLNLFVSRTDSQKVQSKILNGLVMARRKDMKESIEELLNRRC